VPISPAIDWMLPHLKLHILHANHPFLLGQVAASKSQKHNIPLVFTFHTRYRDYTHYVPALPTSMVQDFIDAWIGDYLQKCHAVVVPSASIGRMLKADYGLQNGVFTIPTGIDVHRWQQPQTLNPFDEYPDDKILISAGRLEEEKNWECLVGAFSRVVAQETAVRLVILGEGSQHLALEELARKLGVGDRLHLPGQVAGDRLPAYFQAADLFCFASVTETQGLVTLEAMASGLPVVAVRASGTDDVVLNGTTGLLTDNDPEALCQAILTLLRNDDLRAKMALASRQKASEQDARGCAVRLVEVYREAMIRQQAGQRLEPVQTHISFEERLRKLLSPSGG
jgi:glycosyltransferase involved in cell wall biosynthesis